MAKRKDDFEAQLLRLQQIVQELEGGEQPLERGVALFREGVELAKACRKRLEEARNEVSLLTADGLKEFQTEDDDDAA
ncbi:exodeoxyribonuclease VII small subunit [Desulfobaculum xiamenense]|uniref:Exodeoxyribonuclease 7 small subunit n=1 Tax=Desulfobaculum xiamenense TaxID=995050 RepID=A0A846QMQ3_9BACT|nr:exodeoxyribonuclease VII small subunit [Desulfobaculum xiamenense]NJB69381.1 exodeoxyribonuclease VII small subunit [Desulfobaculum xiamenense]